MLRYLRGLTVGIVVGFFGAIVLEAYVTHNGSDWMNKTAEYWRSC